MKVHVRIRNQEFEVEIGDVHQRPIVALVDGEPFEVWPEGEGDVGAGRPAEPVAAGRSVVEPVAPSAAAHPPSTAGAGGHLVRAPIPGVIVSIAVRPGAEVQVGDELCGLEAMKMRNAIRATRTGRIALVHVSVGQHVRHQDVLIEFEA